MSETLVQTSIWYPFTQIKTAPPPLTVRSASGAWLELASGKRILDLISSWWVTIHGHAHPAIACAIYEQAIKLEQVIFAGFTHEPAEELSVNVCKHLPGNLTRVFFSDNGATAVEVALKMSCQYWVNKGTTNRTKYIAFDKGYYGETVGSMSVGAMQEFFRPFKPLLFEVDFIPFPFISDEGLTAIAEKEQNAIASLELLLEKGANSYAGIIIEPLVQGVGGMRICRPQFLKTLEDTVRAHDLILIYDEVMTGFGRTGDWFACQKSHTKPDIICLSKGLTGGFMPLALTVTTEKIYEAFLSNDIRKAFYHSHSYMANPIACAASNASIKLLEKEPEKFKNMELVHQALIDKWLAGHCKLKNIRTCGTIAAFDVVASDGTGYFDKVGFAMREKFLQDGLLIRPLGNTIYLMPPYCITGEELELAYAAIAKIVGSL